MATNENARKVCVGSAKVKFGDVAALKRQSLWHPKMVSTAFHILLDLSKD